MNASDIALNRLYEQSVSFRLYADHASGLSLIELAELSGQSERWVSERIESMRLCLEKQVRVEVASDPPVCPEKIWSDQVWD